MTEQMEERMNEQRLRDAAELERCIRETGDKLIDLRTQQAALLAGQPQAAEFAAEEREDFDDAVCMAELDAQADLDDFLNNDDPFAST